MRSLRNAAMVMMMYFLGCVASYSECTVVAGGAIISGAIFAIADMICEERR